MKAREYYRSMTASILWGEPGSSDSLCFQTEFWIMASTCTAPIPHTFRDRRDVFKCLAWSSAAQSMTLSGCLRKAPCLAPCAAFRLILLQKRVETGCSPWRREKESKGTECVPWKLVMEETWTPWEATWPCSLKDKLFVMQCTRGSCVLVIPWVGQSMSNLT